MRPQGFRRAAETGTRAACAPSPIQLVGPGDETLHCRTVLMAAVELAPANANLRLSWGSVCLGGLDLLAACRTQIGWTSRIFAITIIAHAKYQSPTGCQADAIYFVRNVSAGLNNEHARDMER